MTSTTEPRLRRPAGMAVLAVLIGAMMTSCGSNASKHTASVSRSASATGPAPAGSIVVQIGGTSITGAMYNHWMAIGAATVEMPKPTGPVPKPVAYEPPDFTACVAHLHPGASKSTTAQLRVRCRTTYEGIQSRILNFLITGYWLRGAAVEQHAPVSEAEVRKKFEEEKRANYPTVASFRRLQEASRQTVPDLMFAVETRMLSAKLLEKLTKAHGHAQSEQATITAFNEGIRSTWTAKTDCQPGYVVKDCRQYKR